MIVEDVSPGSGNLRPVLARRALPASHGHRAATRAISRQSTAGASEIRLRIRTQEQRYIVADGIEQLESLLGAHGQPIEYVVGRPETLITTVYFDTPEGTWSQGRSQLKLRARSYQDPEAWWFELKRREGSRVDKWRRPMSVRAVLSTLSGHDRWRPVGRAVGASPLTPQFGVQCRRTAFEWPGLRVTVDRGLTYFDVDPKAPLELGRRCGYLDGVVIEVKQRHGMPSWLEGALDGREAKAFSKSRFGIALRDGSERPFLIVDGTCRAGTPYLPHNRTP